MTIATNADLQAWLAKAARRTDLAEQIQDFINSAHARIAPKGLVFAEVSISAQALTLPADFYRVHSLWILREPLQQLTQVSQDQLARLNTAGLPSWYNIAEAEVGPAPDRTYEGRLLYRVPPTKFAQDADTNAILQAYPFLYVHGAQCELARFLGNMELEEAREALFASELEAMNQAELAKVFDGAALQMTPSTSVA